MFISDLNLANQVIARLLERNQRLREAARRFFQTERGGEMPFYKYQCLECGRPDMRIASLDDHTAICALCGGLMLRTDQDIFAPLFQESPDETLVAP